MILLKCILKKQDMRVCAVGWIHLVQDKVLWQAVVNMITNLQVA
jgi:hypothetical protein